MATTPVCPTLLASVATVEEARRSLRISFFPAWVVLACFFPGHCGSALSADWPQFRGPGGQGVAVGADPPLTWSQASHLAWKRELPGPGSSSPIVVGDRVFVTCFSGHNPRGPVNDLQRHLFCLQLADGELLWERIVPVVMPEDKHSGYLTEHGYASSTPASDGLHVYVLLGKAGVYCFDMAGAEVWKVRVGRGAGSNRWGSAASPILHGKLLIVNAADESQSLRALDRLTGKEVWKEEAASLDNSWCTPTLVELADGRRELVLAVPREIWGLNPDTGRLLWFVETVNSPAVCTSPVTGNGVVYAMAGRAAGIFAIRAGGERDVTRSHVLWKSSTSSYVPSPILHDGRLIWVNEQGVVNCFAAKTGETVYQQRLPDLPAEKPEGIPFYASLVRAGDRLYAVSRRGGTYVLAAGPRFELLAHNVIADDPSEFQGTPAISGDRLILRSNQCIYCFRDAASGAGSR